MNGRRDEKIAKLFLQFVEPQLHGMNEYKRNSVKREIRAEIKGF